MIINKLKPCYNDCEDIDAHVETVRDAPINADGEFLRICDTHIYCRHYYVCKKYIECDKEPSKI